MRKRGTSAPIVVPLETEAILAAAAGVPTARVAVAAEAAPVAAAEQPVLRSERAADRRHPPQVRTVLVKTDGTINFPIHSAR